MKKSFETPSRTSPKNDKRGCLCKDGRTYSRKCCDGTLRAQGVGKISGILADYLAQEDEDLILQENYFKIQK